MIENAAQVAIALKSAHMATTQVMNESETRRERVQLVHVDPVPADAAEPAHIARED